MRAIIKTHDALNGIAGSTEGVHTSAAERAYLENADAANGVSLLDENGITSLVGNDGNASYTLLNLYNDDTPADGEVSQSADIVFKFRGDVLFISGKEGAKISAYKTRDWQSGAILNYAAGLKFYVTENSGSGPLEKLALTLNEDGKATFADTINLDTKDIIGCDTINCVDVNINTNGVVLKSPGGEGSDNFIVGATSTIDDGTYLNTILGAGRSSFPNKIGAVGAKPQGDPGTVNPVLTSLWVADAAYVDDSAWVATIMGGYDQVVNQLAGHMLCQHGFMPYNAVGHSIIMGKSYNLNAGARCGIISSQYCAINVGSLLSDILGSHISNILDSNYSSITNGSDAEIDTADYAFASGRRAKISSGADGAWCITDSTDADFTNATSDSFSARFSGGYNFDGDGPVDFNASDITTTGSVTANGVGLGVTSASQPEQTAQDITTTKTITWTNPNAYAVRVTSYLNLTGLNTDAETFSVEITSASGANTFTSTKPSGDATWTIAVPAYLGAVAASGDYVMTIITDNASNTSIAFTQVIESQGVA